MRDLPRLSLLLVALTTASCVYPKLTMGTATDASVGTDSTKLTDGKVVGSASEVAVETGGAGARTDMAQLPDLGVADQAKVDVAQLPDLALADQASGGDLASDVPIPRDGAADSSVDIPATRPDAGLDAVEPGPVCPTNCNDGIGCTTDTCVAGVCKNTLNPGYCVIDYACYLDGATNSADACKACTLATSTSLWTVQPEGAFCGTGMSCQSHVCTACGAIGQACCGTAVPGTCAMGAACDASTNKCQADKAIDISGTMDTVCALLKSGNVRCWGTNGAMLGASTGSNVAAPPISGLEDAVDVSVGRGVACAVRATGGVVCWGSALPGGGSSTGSVVTAASFAGVFGNYLQESCNTKSGSTNYGGPEAVLVWTAPSDGTYQFDTNGSTFDTVLAAFKGNPQPSSELACNDDGVGLKTASSVQVQVVTGDKLTLVLDSKSNPTPPATFSLIFTKQ